MIADVWQVLQIGEFQKVFCADKDHWRLNSGVTQIINYIGNDKYYIKGFSGSTYEVPKNSYGIPLNHWSRKTYETMITAYVSEVKANDLIIDYVKVNLNG